MTVSSTSEALRYSEVWAGLVLFLWRVLFLFESLFLSHYSRPRRSLFSTYDRLHLFGDNVFGTMWDDIARSSCHHLGHLSKSIHFYA